MEKSLIDQLLLNEMPSKNLKDDKLLYQQIFTTKPLDKKNV